MSVHPIGDQRRPRYLNKHGELHDWMPQDAGPEARNMIDGLLSRLASTEAALTKERRLNEKEDIARAVHQQIVEVLTYWRDTCSKHPERVRFPPASKRYKKTKERLGEGWSPDDLKRVVDYALTDEWLNGTHAESPGYLDPETLFRDPEQVEKRLGQWYDAQEVAFDERSAKWMERHAPEMALALEQERQLGVLVGLEPTAFEPLPSELGGAA